MIQKSGTFRGFAANNLKGVSDISAKFLHTAWNDEVLNNLKFPSELKLADIVPALKREHPTLVKNIDQSVFCQLFQRFLRELRLIKLSPT